MSAPSPEDPTEDRAVVTTRIAAELARIADEMTRDTEVNAEEALICAAMPYLLRYRFGRHGLVFGQR